MSRLVYDADRRLRDGERVLADFTESGPYGCIVVDRGEYEIAHRGHSGWHFRVLDASGESACEYDPYRVVRGGRLKGRWSAVSLRGVPLRAARWTFSSESDWRIRARLLAAQRLVGVGEGNSSPARSYEVRLDGELPIISSEASLQLAFGCWILVERQSLPGGGGGGG